MLVVGCSLAALLAAGCSKDSPRPPDTPLEPPTASPASASAPIASPSASTAASAPPSASATTSASAASAPAPAPSTRQVVTGATKLLDPGRAPRKKLRYAWHVDRKEQLVMDLRTAASTEIGGAKQSEIPLPPVHVAVDLDPKSVGPDGELHYGWRVAAATVTADAQMPAQIVDGMRTEVSAIEHLAGTGIVSSRGLAQDVTIDPASVVDAGATGQMVEQVRQTLRDLEVPFPEEEVGRGARWQKIAQLETKGSRLTQTDTFTLGEVKGDLGSVDDVLAQTAPPQSLHAPGMPNGAEARMESMLASGSSKMAFDLGRIVPQSKFDGTTTMVVSGQPAGPGAPGGAEGPHRVTMVMRVGIDLAGKPR
jgi:hypothetical protein